MRKNILFTFWMFFMFNMSAQAQDNTLNIKEQKQGWILLFNGKNLDGWTAVGKTTPPQQGWVVENGAIITNKGGTARGGDIITKEEYGEFDLQFEYKLSKGANSGVKYFVQKYGKSWLGNEFQVIDEEHHPEREQITGVHKTASLYDLYETKGKIRVKPYGQWNKGRIVSKGSRVTHYLNGKKVLTYDRKDENYKKAVQRSKFKNVVPTFGTIEKGYILLQDHQDEVFFKNIKIKDLSAK